MLADLLADCAAGDLFSFRGEFNVADALSRREYVRIEMKPGDRVTAGVSVLARYEVDEMRGTKWEL